MAVALLLSPERAWLRTRWPWLAVAIALALFLPNLVWQVRHDFPTLEDLRNVRRTGKNVVLGPVEFVGQQVMMLHPVLLPLWLGGLAWLFAGARGRYRVLGWTFVVFFAMLFALQREELLPRPDLPDAARGRRGGVEARSHRCTRPRDRRWPKGGDRRDRRPPRRSSRRSRCPSLSPERYVAYEQALGFAPPKTEVGHRGPLPQHFGDRFGWPELVAEVARIYHALPPEDRARAAIFANNYGEAGAINLFGPRLRAAAGDQRAPDPFPVGARAATRARC